MAASALFLFPLLSVPLVGALGGEEWRSFGLRGETVIALSAISGEEGTILFAQTPAGLWRRAMGEAGKPDAAWTRIDQGLPHSPLGAPLLAAWRNVPGRPLQLYALAGRTDARQLFRSDDGGSSWRSVGPAPGQSRSPAMAVMPGLGEDPDMIVIATNTRVQRSLDGGATWTPGGEWPLESDIDDPVLLLASEATGPDRLLALERSGRLWLSDSGGLSWHDIGGDSARVALATAPYFRLAIWTASAGALHWSDDEGRTWTDEGLPNGRQVLARRQWQVEALALDPRVSDTVYASLTGGSVFRFSGGVWQSLGAPPAAAVRFLSVDPDSRSALYAGTDDGVWVRPVIAAQPTATPSPAATPLPSATPEPSATPAPTATATKTFSPTPSPTATWTATPTATASVTPTETPTATATATLRPTRRPTATVQPTPTLVPTQPVDASSPAAPTTEPGPNEPGATPEVPASAEPSATPTIYLR